MPNYRPPNLTPLKIKQIYSHTPTPRPLPAPRASDISCSLKFQCWRFFEANKTNKTNKTKVKSLSIVPPNSLSHIPTPGPIAPRAKDISLSNKSYSSTILEPGVISHSQKIVPPGSAPQITNEISSSSNTRFSKNIQQFIVNKSQTFTTSTSSNT